MKFLIVIILNCATDIVALFLRGIPAVNGIDLIRSKLLPWYCNTVLRLYSKKLTNQVQQKDEPAIYTFNHQGSADLIILGSLGYTQARFFISRSTLWLLPLTLFMKTIKAFYLSEQKYPEKRKKEFANACTELKRYKESAIISPEGQRSGKGVLLNFNKGAFHLAKDLHYPIIPLFIVFQKEGYKISQLEEISSSQVEQLTIEQLRDHCHELYLKASS